jgi:hypothetical protein
VTLVVKSQVLGGFKSLMETRLQSDAKAVSDAVWSQTAILKNNWRAQIRGAGLSARLANTVRSETFPKVGYSLHAAGVVSVARGTPQKVLSELQSGAVITTARGRFLAVPTENVPKGPRGMKLGPHQLEVLTGYRLRFAQNRRGTKMLIADTVQSVSRRGGIRPATRGRVSRGRKVTPLVFYILVPQVTIKKRLRLYEEAERIGADLAAMIAERMT